MAWQRLRFIRFRQNAKALIEEIQSRINALEAQLPSGRAQYLLYYNELKRMYLASSEWKYLLSEFELEYSSYLKEANRLKQIVATHDNYHKLVSDILLHNGNVNVYIDQLSRVLTDIYDADDVIRTIRREAKEKDWGLPGRPAPTRKYNTFLEIVAIILRSLSTLGRSYVELRDHAEEDLIVPIPEEPPGEKLFRVQLMFKVTAEVQNEVKTPEVIAEIRVWFYTRAFSKEIAESKLTERDMYNSILDLINQEFYDSVHGATRHVFDSLYNALYANKIEINPDVKGYECEEIDEDEPVYEIGSDWEEDKLYHGFTFFKSKVGRAKAPVYSYDQKYIDQVLRGEMQIQATPPRLAELPEEKLRRKEETQRRRREAREEREKRKQAARLKKVWTRFGVKEGDYISAMENMKLPILGRKLTANERKALEAISVERQSTLLDPEFLLTLGEYIATSRELSSKQRVPFRPISIEDVLGFADNRFRLFDALGELKALLKRYK